MQHYARYFSGRKPLFCANNKKRIFPTTLSFNQKKEKVFQKEKLVKMTKSTSDMVIAPGTPLGTKVLLIVNRTF